MTAPNLPSVPPTLPPFPVDDFTLDQVEHALGTCLGDRDPVTGVHELVGGEFTMPRLLDFLSGYDPSRSVLLSGDPDAPDGDGPFGLSPDTPIYEYPGQIYSRDSVIRALIAEVRRLRGDES